MRCAASSTTRRTQTRKTSAQVQQLADSIAALVDAQRKRSRWLNVNSFVAYLMFTLLCAGAFYFVYQSRVHEVVGARDRAATDRDAAVRRADEANGKLAARDAADAKAWDAWQALEAGKNDDAAKKLAELKAAPLSKFEHEVLAARAKQAEMMQVDAAMKAANTAFKAGRYGEVVVTLESALNLQGRGAARAGDPLPDRARAAPRERSRQGRAASRDRGRRRCRRRRCAVPARVGARSRRPVGEGARGVRSVRDRASAEPVRGVRDAAQRDARTDATARAVGRRAGCRRNRRRRRRPSCRLRRLLRTRLRSSPRRPKRRTPQRR